MALGNPGIFSKSMPLVYILQCYGWISDYGANQSHYSDTGIFIIVQFGYTVIMQIL